MSGLPGVQTGLLSDHTGLSRTDARVERLPLSRFTTLGVGGVCEVWTVSDHAQLREAMSAPYRILGGGSNLVVSDAGVPERVIRLSGEFATTDLAPDPLLSTPAEHVTGWIGGGVPLPGLLRRLQRLGLSNLEGTVGIPAQLGGAVWMNAGTRFGEVFGGLHSLEIVTPLGARIVTPEELPWGYRNSGIPRNHIVTRARLRLRPSTPGEVQARMEGADSARRGQPKNRTPGCAFKNPAGEPGRPGAGTLIDRAGLKGRRVGNARIAPEHANFIVNLGGASSHDVHALLELMRAAVEVPLELEVELWG